MNEREVQLELPFDSSSGGDEHVVQAGAAVLSLEFIRVQRHAEAMLRELISEGFVQRLEA